MTCAAALMAIGAFFSAKRVEGLLASFLTTMTLVLPHRAFHPEAKPYDPVMLPHMLIEQDPAVYLVDLREPPACQEKRISGALCLKEQDPPGGFVADLPPTRRLVLYAEGEVSSLPELARRFQGEISVLQRGFKAFSHQILTEPLVTENPRPQHIEKYGLVSALQCMPTLPDPDWTMRRSSLRSNPSRSRGRSRRAEGAEQDRRVLTTGISGRDTEGPITEGVLTIEVGALVQDNSSKRSPALDALRNRGRSR